MNLYWLLGLIKSASNSIFNWCTSAYGYMGKEISFAMIFFLIKKKNLQKHKFKCVILKWHKDRKIIYILFVVMLLR